MEYTSDFKLFRTWWKSSKPITHGYNKSYIAKTPGGDILRVEYNFKEGIVKLSIRNASEKGKEYIAIVKKGTSIREKDISTNSNIPFKKKLLPFRDIFSSIPDDEILKSLGGIYGISIISRGIDQEDKTPDLTGEFSVKPSIPGETFFQRLRRVHPKQPKKPLWQRIKERFWGEVHDLAIGASLSIAIYFNYYDYIVLGASIAALGFVFGGLDWIVRNRAPLLSKVVLFLIIGSYFFYTGYTTQ